MGENERRREADNQPDRVRHQQRPVGGQDREKTTGNYGSEEGGQKLLRRTKGRRPTGFQATVGAFAHPLEGASGPRHPADVQA